MKLYIKFSVLTIMLCILTVAGFTQKKQDKSLSPKEIAEKQTIQMVEKLKLNEEQSKTVSAINLTYAIKRHALRMKRKDNKAKMKEVKTNMRAEKSTKMEQVLSAKQFDLYTEMEAKRKGKKRNKGMKNKG